MNKENKSDNLTRQALINNPMVINKADKGSTIVVQDRSEYIAEAMKHLNDETTLYFFNQTLRLLIFSFGWN
jgi:hypothetical protein